MIGGTRRTAGGGAPGMRRGRRLRCGLAMLALAGLAGAAGAAPQAQQSVGLTELDADGLPVTLVYPTEAPAQTHSFGPFEIEAAKDAPVRPGRYRLVVMSHGTGGSSRADHALAAHLARAGFVVAQPLHRGDNYRDSSGAGPESWRRRPGEVSAVIDAMAGMARWAEVLDLERVGVHGMSAGGVTALALAGAQWRMLELIRHCNEHAGSDATFCFQGAEDAGQREARRARFERVRGVPDEMLPAELKNWHGGRTPAGPESDPRPDSRIAAVTLAVPVAAIFSAESLGRIDIPVGVVSAGADEVLLPRFHSDHVLRHCARCRSLLELGNAAHFDLLWPWPEEIAHEVARQFLRGGMPSPDFDPAGRERAHERIGAFLLEQLGPPDRGGEALE